MEFNAQKCVKFLFFFFYENFAAEKEEGAKAKTWKSQARSLAKQAPFSFPFFFFLGKVTIREEREGNRQGGKKDVCDVIGDW